MNMGKFLFFFLLNYSLLRYGQNAMGSWFLPIFK